MVQRLSCLRLKCWEISQRTKGLRYRPPTLMLRCCTRSPLAQMRATVTNIFHVAYPLNFNLGVQAFEPQVAFVRSLVDFAAQSSLHVKPRITFASSGGTMQNWRQDEWVQEVKTDVSTAVGTGYGESKRVCEMVRGDPWFCSTLEMVLIWQTLGSRVGVGVSWTRGRHCAHRSVVWIAGNWGLECERLGAYYRSLVHGAVLSSGL